MCGLCTLQKGSKMHIQLHEGAQITGNEMDNETGPVYFARVINFLSKST